LRPPVECISALCGFDLGKALGDGVALGRAEALDRGLLALQAKAGLTASGADADVGVMIGLFMSNYITVAKRRRR
jgi:hypothetical protein